MKFEMKYEVAIPRGNATRLSNKLCKKALAV